MMAQPAERVIRGHGALTATAAKSGGYAIDDDSGRVDREAAQSPPMRLGGQ